MISAPPPVVGIGIGRPDGFSYLGDLPNDGAASESTHGSEPLAPGASASWTVTWANVGNIRESLTIGQAAGWAKLLKVTQVPASWVTLSGPASVASLNPGASATETVTVTVPITAKAGLYGGLLTGTASAVTTSHGGTKVSVSAGDKEYIAVT
jgi:hypothetical protein